MINLKLIARGVFLCVLLTAGCMSSQDQPAPIKIKNLKHETDPDVSCQINDYRHLVGKVYQEVVSELPKHRWKRPGFMYTQEYISDRLNVVTDSKGIIIGLKCG